MGDILVLMELIVFKSLNSVPPQLISDLLHFHVLWRSLRSADQLCFVVPNTRQKMRGDCAFSAAAPKL